MELRVYVAYFMYPAFLFSPSTFQKLKSIWIKNHLIIKSEIVYNMAESKQRCGFNTFSLLHL